MRLFLVIIVSALIEASSFAQSNDLVNNKLGIKTSINLSSMVGSTFENPRIKFGYTAGSYFISNPKKKTSVYAEIIGNFKGSSFNNGDIGYSKIALFYVDASLLPKFQLKNKHAICIGPTLSYLGLSSLYVGDKKKSEIDKLNIKPWDCSLALYYHIPKTILTIQFGTKIGLLNINNNLILNNVFPAINPKGSIQNISFEIGMLF